MRRSASEISDLDPRLATAEGAQSAELCQRPAWKLRQDIVQGACSSVEVTQSFLDRIDLLDGEIHAFRMVDQARAREQAAARDAALRSGVAPGPLHGVPVAIKEHIPTKGLMWHNLATGEKSISPVDAVEVERLRHAGAVIIGTLVAGGAELSDSDDPRNPWDLERVPGISSPGAAAATAAAMIPLAIAADGLGSTRLPAAFCGMVGLHSTRGRVPSVAPGILNPRLLTTSGPIARCVRDAAIALQVLAGPDGRDFVCLQDDPPDYLVDLDAGCAGMRLVWTDDFGFADRYARPETPRILEQLGSLTDRLASAGAKVRRTSVTCQDPGWAGLLVYATDPLIAANGAVPPEDVQRCRDTRQAIWRAFREMLSDADFILSPTSQSIAPTRADWTQDWRDPSFMHHYAAYTAAANLLGWPAITVPAGRVDSMPVGLQIIGKPNSEKKMLQLAYAVLAVAEGLPT